MNYPLTINGKRFGIEHIATPTALAKQTNKGHWYPNMRYDVYKNQKFVTRLYHNLLHKSGNIVFISQGYSDKETAGFALLKKWFANFDFYTIINKTQCHQPIQEVIDAYKNIGVNALTIENNISGKTGPILNKLPKKHIVVGEQHNGYAIDILGGFQVYNSYFKNYTDPYHSYSDYKQFVLDGKKKWKDLLLKTEEVNYHTSYHTKPPKNPIKKNF